MKKVILVGKKTPLFQAVLNCVELNKLFSWEGQKWRIVDSRPVNLREVDVVLELV
ncbi:MAG: hypothetical protein ACPG5L_16210 [Vibrio gallaecicus]